MPTEQQLSARIEMLHDEARRAIRRSPIALLPAITGHALTGKIRDLR